MYGKCTANPADTILYTAGSAVKGYTDFQVLLFLMEILPVHGNTEDFDVWSVAFDIVVKSVRT